MSQHDFDLTTADANTGPTVRAGMNAMAQALASGSSGATEPSTTYAYQFWADTTSGYMKQRNAANNAWLVKWKMTAGEMGALGIAAGNALQADQAVTTIASATSTALAGTNKQYITGTTPIETFTGTAGMTYRCENVSLLPLVHSAGLSVLNWGLNVTFAPNTTFDVYMVTANTCVVFNIHYNRDYKRLNTANGYGSTNNKIRRLTNIVDNIGGSFTYADSAANGGSFTINATGIYSGSYCDQFNVSATIGISLNSNQLTTSITGITQSHILTAAVAPNANQPVQCSFSGVFMTAGDVVRLHTDGAASGSTTPACIFTMGRVG